MRVTDSQRSLFDRLFEEAMFDLPPDLQERMEEVFVNVEDVPDGETLRKMGLRHPGQLRGLYTGVPLTRRHSFDSGRMPDSISLYRLGILSTAMNGRGEVDQARLRAQIRITLLHEIGHHFGMDEDDLAAYGYA